jgi:hypothetical protein
VTDRDLLPPGTGTATTVTSERFAELALRWMVANRIEPLAVPVASLGMMLMRENEAGFRRRDVGVAEEIAEAEERGFQRALDALKRFVANNGKDQ